MANGLQPLPRESVVNLRGPLGYSLVVSLAAFMLLLYPVDVSVFLFAASLGAISGIGILYSFFARPRTIRFTSALAASALLGYGLGTIITAVLSYVFFGGYRPRESAVGLAYFQEDLSASLMLIFVACAILLCISLFESPLFKAPPRLEQFPVKRSLALLLACTGLVFVAYLTGTLGYHGVAVEATKNINAVGALAMLVAPPALGLAILCMLLERHLPTRLLYLCFALFFGFAQIPIGRRQLIYSCVIALFAVALAPRRRRSRKMLRRYLAVTGAALLIGVVVGASYFFFALRMAGYISHRKVTLVERATGAAKIVRTHPHSVARRLETNVRGRTYILSYVATLFSAERTHLPIHGEEVDYALESAVPSIFFPQKTSLLPAEPEEFVHPALGLPVFDGPNSIFTAGLADFGVLGLLSYPAFVALLYAALRRLVVERLPRPIYYFVVFRLLFQLLSIETALSGLVTTALRDLALCSLFLYLVWGLAGVRLLRTHASSKLA